MSKPANQKIKMSDIARLAGVSESTVSRALKNCPRVTEKTRLRIQEIVREHNYVIDKRAQGLRTQSSKTVAVVIPVIHEPNQHVSDPFFLEIIGAIADALADAGYDMLLSLVKRDNWRRKIEGNAHVDGVIIVGQSDLHEEINEFARSSPVPFVVWGAALPDQDYESVGCDNLLGGRQAAGHLLERGKRKLVFLGNPHVPEVALRYQGVQLALSEAGAAEPVLACAGFTPESGGAAMGKLLDSGEAFDGIVAASDVLAVCALKSLLRGGVRVPEDVAVIGYDDIALAAQMHPALSTVAQGIGRGGRELVSTLFALMRGQAVQNVVLPPNLVVRETS